MVGGPTTRRGPAPAAPAARCGSSATCRAPGGGWSASPGGRGSRWRSPAAGGSRCPGPRHGTTPTTPPAPSPWPTGAAAGGGRPAPGGLRRGGQADGAARPRRRRVVDDYAHHPAEILATLAAARERGPARIVVVFQPHLPSRTRALGAEIGAALGAADVVVVTDVYLAREPADPAATGARVAERVPPPARALHAPSPRRGPPPSPRSGPATSSSPWGRATSPVWGRSWWPAWKNSPSMGIPTTAPAPPELERDAPLAPLTSIRVGAPPTSWRGSARSARPRPPWPGRATRGCRWQWSAADPTCWCPTPASAASPSAWSAPDGDLGARQRPVVRGGLPAARRAARGGGRPGGPGVGGEHPRHGRRP